MSDPHIHDDFCATDISKTNNKYGIDCILDLCFFVAWRFAILRARGSEKETELLGKQCRMNHCMETGELFPRKYGNYV